MHIAGCRNRRRRFRRLYGHRTLSERFLSSVRTDRLRIQRRAEGIYALRFRKRGIRPRGADRRERKGKDKAVFRREPAGSAGFRQLYSHFGAESRTGGKQHGARAGIPLPRAREDCGSGLSGTLCRAGAESAEQRRRRPLCGSATATDMGCVDVYASSQYAGVLSRRNQAGSLGLVGRRLAVLSDELVFLF